MSIISEFQSKFRVDDLKIYESEHWIWSLRPHQATLGAGILSLKRECQRFSQLSVDEFSDLHNIIGVIEGRLKEQFGYEVLNYLMLMMFDRHVHYHVLPRYDKPVAYKGQEWVDSAYPGIPKLVGDSFGDTGLASLLAELKAGLKA